MNTADLEVLVAPLVENHQLEIDRVEILNAGKRAVVRVFLDGDGDTGRGPSLDQISAATRDISAALDNADLTRGRPYTLEVSSRGVSQPLTQPRHFRRNRGRLVACTLSAGSLTGRIVSVSDENLVLEVDGQPVTLELGDIRRAVVQVELNRPVAEGEPDDLEGDFDGR